MSDSRERFHRCQVTGCVAVAVWHVTTSGGQRAFCANHAAWYIAAGTDIYPAERIAAPIVATARFPRGA